MIIVFDIVNIWSFPGPMVIIKENQYLLIFYEKLNYTIKLSLL